MKDSTGKRKILTDRTFPNSEQINKHQNFERLQKDYSVIKKLLLKKIILWSSAAIIGLAGVAGLLFLNKNKSDSVLTKTGDKSVSATEACIQPPVPGMEAPFISYRISVKEGAVIQFSTGSTFTIPANAFVKENGEALSDSIDIKYREFHDPLAIFLSGIPMHYDSAGIMNTLESAGMLEILAFDQEKSLRLKEETPIQISMASKNNEERFNLYELDTLQKNWVYKGKDKIEKLNSSVAPEKKRQTTTRQFDSQPGSMPGLADPEKFSFKIAYDEKEFPELAAYEHVVFEVTDKNFKPSYFKINWNKISLYNSDHVGEYLVKLKKADTTISVTAKPVFEKGDYASALEKFEAKNKQVSMKRDQEEFEKQAAISKVNKSLTSYNSNKIVSAARVMANIVVFRNFAIRNMGVHNCDFPLPPILQYAYSFQKINKQKNKTLTSEEFAYSTIFLIEKGKNTVFRFTKGEPVRCNPSAKNLMWTMTDKNQVAFFRINDYTKLLNGKENSIDPVVAQNQDLAFEEIKKFSE